MVEDGKKFLRSRRPLFYNIRMHIEIIKENADRSKKVLKSDNEYIQEYNKVDKKSEYIQKIFNDYLQYVDDVKNKVVIGDRITNGKYMSFLNGLSNTYISKDIKNSVDYLINNDVVYDKDKKYETDYYIEFLGDEIPDNIKFDDNNKKYRIINRLTKYTKGDKEYEYFIPNFINVKSRAVVNQDKLYPVLMLSTRFNKELGSNNLENWQAMIIIKNIVN
jgi:hypothetical protein